MLKNIKNKFPVYSLKPDLVFLDSAASALKVDNTSTTQHWKLGTFRLDIQPDGRR